MSERRVILIACSFYFPHRGGVEYYTRSLAESLAAEGFEIRILTNNTNQQPACEATEVGRVWRLPSWPMLGGRYPFPAPRQHRIMEVLEGASLLITHTRFFPLTWWMIEAARRVGLPLLHIEHGASSPGGIAYLPSLLIDRWIGWRLARLATHVVAVSAKGAAFMARMGVPQAKLSVVPNGVPRILVEQPPHTILASFGIYTGLPIVIYAGRFSPEKGVVDLLSAFVDTGARAMLLLVGDGDQRAALESRFSRDNIRFLGPQPRERVWELLSAARIVVNPSHRESLPTVVLEAGALGRAVIATAVGGTGEIIADGESGLLVPAGDSQELGERLVELLEDPDRCEQLGSALARAVKERYTWDIVARPLIELVGRLTNC